jgi:hypothetical protein
MKNNILWINLLKSDKKRDQIIWWNPEITDRFLDNIERENKEWKTPPKLDIVIYHYSDHYHHINSQYTINRNWEIKSLKWEVMKYIYYTNKRGPRVRIKIEKKDNNWNNITSEKEIWILQLMDKIFWMYLPWFSQKKENPNDYILVPKDWNYNNMKYDNLHYITQKEYYSTKVKLIENVLLMWTGYTNEELSKMFQTTQKYIQKIKTNLAKSWKLIKFQKYQDLQKEIWIEFNEESLRIYQALVECRWQLPNIEIAKLLRPKELEESKNKSYYTDKIVRVRKKLVDKWIIARINWDFEDKRAEAVRMIKDKKNSGKTNQEIADVLWLKKTQINNLARQIKKEERKNNY